jgi:hypothetical protein
VGTARVASKGGKWVKGTFLGLLGRGHSIVIRVAPVAPGVAAAQRISPKDAAIFQRASELIRSSGATQFMDKVSQLATATKEVLGRTDVMVYKLGTFQGSPVYGSAVTKLGIVNVNGVTTIVREIGSKFTILGPLLP